MFGWLRDLINTFKRPINGDVPNYGNIPDEVLQKKFFGDGREEELWKDWKPKQKK